MNTINWNKFHDSLFDQLVINWPKGEIIISITADKPYYLEVKDFTNISLTRELDWGKSIHINTIEVLEKDPNHVELKIQIQSGDVLGIIGSSISIH